MVVAAGLVVVAGEGLAALEADGGKVVWTDAAARAAVAPVVGAGGVVLGEDDGQIRARDLATGTRPLVAAHGTGASRRLR